MNARLRTGGPSPQRGPPSHGRCSLNGTPRRGRCPARGPRVNQGTPLPFRLGPATSRATWLPVLCRSCTTLWSRSREAKVSGLRGHPRGQLPYTDDPARTPPGPFPELPDSTPKAYRLGLETTTLRQLLPVNALGLDRCMEQRLGRVKDPEDAYSSHGAAPRGRPGAGGTLLVSTLIPRSSLSG